MATHDQGSRLPLALHSALTQDTGDYKLGVLLLDDQSNDDWHISAGTALQDERLAVVSGTCGSAAQARNALLDLVDKHAPNARWIARLDADDVFATPHSLRALVEAGEEHNATYVLGSNHLSMEGTLLDQSNMADAATLQDPLRLAAFIEAFCSGSSRHELPSCNLVIRSKQDIRYPLTESAEDHWLVSSLLMFRPKEGVIVRAPVYCTYRLDGDVTKGNRRLLTWQKSRSRLREASRVWLETLTSADEILGHGMEGIVSRQGAQLVKRFYSWAMTKDRLASIHEMACLCPRHIVQFEPQCDLDSECVAILTDRMMQRIATPLPLRTVQDFLMAIWHAGIVTSNIKRDNLRQSPDGNLVYIDIGSDIVKLTASRFLDCSARLYAVACLGWSDFELSRRKTTRREEEVLASIPGFSDFYLALIKQLHPVISCFPTESNAKFKHTDVTLLIKCCPQDADIVDRQVKHLVSSLAGQVSFSKKVLLVDPYEGPYLRHHQDGNAKLLFDTAHELLQSGWIDQIWVAPTGCDEISAVFQSWFNVSSRFSHTTQGAPLFSQIWAFERVTTRYVLQLDVDVIIGRSDNTHDYLGDMLNAIYEPDVWCVAFNIPKSELGWQAYSSGPQGYVPEVRLGLLDLHRIKAHRPFSNPLQEGRFTLMWHRALEQVQQTVGMRTVRGGDSRTYYTHPTNQDKHSALLPVAHDLLSQGLYPVAQADKWDVDLACEWAYPKRNEDLIFLLLGRNTPENLLSRCLESLRIQSRQDFGVILIDDGSDTATPHKMPGLLGSLAYRTSLVRHTQRLGYLANFMLAVEELCLRDDSLLVVLDQDDALLSPTVADSLWHAWSDGAELINAPMFRPDKPLKIYEADYAAPRSKGGGNVWAHLRGFRKTLFMRVPRAEWTLPVEAFDIVSDFLTMVPMSELATKRVWLDAGYAYLHERQAYSAQRKHDERKVLDWLFDRTALCQPRF